MAESATRVPNVSATSNGLIDEVVDLVPDVDILHYVAENLPIDLVVPTETEERTYDAVADREEVGPLP